MFNPRLHLIGLMLVIFHYFASTLTGGGEDAGNGGFGWVGRDNKGDIVSLQFFDLWYAESAELGLTLIDSKESADELGKRIIRRIYNSNRTYFDGLLVSYVKVKNAKVIIDKNLKLRAPTTYLGNLEMKNDEGPIDYGPEPLGVYADVGRLLISSLPWNFLNESDTNPVPKNLQIAAFHVHEALGALFLARQIKELEPGQSLSEETRKSIAKDTVIITAHAFSTLSDLKFRLWLVRYLSTGQAAQVPQVEEIIITRKIFGHKVEGKEAALKDMEEVCRGWKDLMKEFLEEKCEFLFVEFESITTKSVGYPKHQGQALMKIRAVPKGIVLTFDDLITSNFIPYREGLTQKESLDSYDLTFKAWKKDIDDRFGDNVFFRTEDRIIHSRKTRAVSWENHWAGTYKRGWVGLDPEPRGFMPHSSASKIMNKVDYTYRKIGDFMFSVGKVYLFFSDMETDTVEKPIESTHFTCHHPKWESTEIKAAEMAWESWKEKCTEWKKEQYNAGAIFVTCSSGEINHGFDLKSFSTYWTSRGVAYFPLGEIPGKQQDDKKAK